eukprot:6969537-Lingulodinium_polyedra.AAC.1
MGACRSAGAAELLLLDDGLDLMPQEDARQIKEEQKAQKSEEIEFQEMMVELRLARRRLGQVGRGAQTRAK